MKMSKPMPDLVSGRLLARNTIWNLAGQLSPMVVAVMTIPPLVRGLGLARFGVLSIAWIVIGYFSLFDLGIGRALTKHVAEKIGTGEEDAIPSIAWTSLLLLLLLGILAGAVTCAISPWLVYRTLKVPTALQTETLRGFYLLAISIPMVTTTSGLRGVLEAQQRFKILNLIRIPMSIYSFAGPLLVLPFSRSLVSVIATLVAGRFIGCVAHLAACFHAVPALRHNFFLERTLITPLVKTGGWMTVSNLLGPVVLFVDRFVIGAVLSVSAVSYYTAPFDMLTRIWVIPVAISGVLFPAFALTMAQDRSRTELLLRRGLKYTFLATFPVILIIMTLAPEILRLWLGPVFAASSSRVLRWLAAGILMNSVNNIPFSLLQGIGRADIDGKVLFAELPIYLAVTWMLVTHLGIEGAAIAWTARATLELLVFLAFSCRFLPKKTSLLKPFGAGLACALSALYIATFPTGLAFKVTFLFCALLAFAFLTWFLILKSEERLFLARVRLGPAFAHAGRGNSDAV